MRWIEQIKDWIKALIYALVTVMVIKAFLFDVFTVPSSSMKDTLFPGDLIWVNKYAYGVRLPFTPLSFPFSHQQWSLDQEQRAYMDVFALPYIRLFEQSIAKNDVVIFNYPMEDNHPIDHRTYYVKRCVALPGDTLNVKNNEMHIPHRSSFLGNVNDIGSVVVPKKGASIVLDQLNIHLYHRIIATYENNSIVPLDTTFIINGDTTNRYTCKMNYYWMVGDNRSNSLDSRFWGFVPENHIVGKAQRIVFSVDPTPISDNRLRWDRMFQIIE